MTTSILLTPVSVLATGGGPALDISQFQGNIRVHLTALNTAGTNPTLACKVQHADATARGLEQATAGTTDNKLNSAATTNVNLGLAFTQSGAAQISTVALRLKNPGTITAGKKLTLAIKSDTAGSPGATTLGTAATVLCSTIAATYDWVVFTFANPVDLADATVYHLVLSSDYTAHTTNCIYWRSLTAVSGGTVETFDNTNWAAVTATEKFEVYVNQLGFTDVTGGGFVALATAGTASVQTIELNSDNLKQFIRLYNTIGGTSSPAWTTGAFVSGTLGNA